MEKAGNRAVHEALDLASTIPARAALMTLGCLPAVVWRPMLTAYARSQTFEGLGLFRGPTINGFVWLGQVEGQ